MKSKTGVVIIQKHTHQYFQANFAECICTHNPLPLGERNLI